MKKISLFIFAAIVGVTGAHADTVKLSEMFQDKKDNEYAFTQKYENKRLTFDAVVRSIDASCYTKILNWDGDTENIPCAKLDAPDTTIEFLGFDVPIAGAIMENKDDLLGLKRGQAIKLECELTTEYLWDMNSFTFKECKIK